MYPIPKPLRLTSTFLWLAACSLALPSALLAQNAITPTSVITSSFWDNFGLGGHKDKMIDGSGLSGGGSVLTQGHDNNSNVNSWHVGAFPGGIAGGVTGTPPYGAPPPVNTQAVEFDLGANYNLSAAHVWNFNGAGFTERGVKDVKILVSSSDSGVFTHLTDKVFPQATGAAGLAAQVVPLTGATNVRRVRFEILTAWSGLADEYVGLSEVRFEGSPGNNTAPSFALPVGPAGVVWIPRDSARNWQSITSSADGSKLAAAVERGHIYTSTDSGATWTQRESFRYWWSITSSADGTKLAAVDYTGQIYTSTDSGVTWIPRDSNRNWQSITSSADGSKLAAVVLGGQIYTSIDSGATWTPREQNRDWYSITSSADGSKLAAVVGSTSIPNEGEPGGFRTETEGGQIYTSTDSGATWVPRESIRDWKSITSSADGSKLAAVVGDSQQSGPGGFPTLTQGDIYTSTDSGATWVSRAQYRDWRSISSSADGSKLVAGPTYGQIYTSTDSGATWTARDSNRNWWSVTSSADGSKLAAGGPSVQLYTSVSPDAAVSVAAGSGAYAQPFATSISPGPAAESAQTVSFTVTGNTNPGLFTTQPAISPTGTLTFTPASPATTAGTAIISVQLVDNGGNANGGVNTSPVQTFTIKVIPMITGTAITPTVVTTTSQWVGPNDGVRGKMIDGSGLSGGGSVLTQTHDASGTAATMWFAGPNAGGIVPEALGNPPAVNTQAIEFDLGANYDLTGAHIWNFNAAGFTGRGVKDVQILVSSSATGTTWTSVLPTTQLDRGTDAPGLAAQIVPLTGATDVRRVRFAIQSAWSGAANEYVGLSEVRFQGTAVLSTNADLAALAFSAGTLSPAFAAATPAYSFSVPNATTGTTVTATRADANATLQVQVNGGGFTTLTSGIASGTLALTVGSNTVQVRVTAQDTTTTRTYTISVERAAAPPANEVTVAGSNLGAIPDGSPTSGRDILFNVTGAPGVVKTVSTQFTFSPLHAWMSDLRIQLIAPNGTSEWIYQAAESQGNDLLGPYTIADTGVASLQTAATGLAADATLASGTYRAANGATLVSLNLSFAGNSPNGIWKLRFVDSIPPDTTSVSQASLTLTTASPGKPTIAYQTDGSKVFILTQADANSSYLLQGSDNLSTWIPLQTLTTNGTGASTHTDTTARGPRYFYRAVPIVTPGL